MKKLLALILASVMVFSMAACSSSSLDELDAALDVVNEELDAAIAETEAEEAAPAEAAAADDDIVIAGIVFQDDQFMNLLTAGYVDAANDLGVTIMTDNTNVDQARETELINTYLAQGVDGIAISPINGDASTASLKAASEEGMAVALTNIDVNNADFIVAGFTSDDWTNCQLVGVEAAQMIKDKHGDDLVKIGLIQFATILPDNSGNRVNSYLACLDDAGVNYEVVADQDAWLQDTALEAASGILIANPDLDVIIAVNDGGTIGSVMAVQNAGLSDQVMVFGHDGSDQISAMILDESGPLQAVIAQDPYNQGYMAVTALVSYLRGEDYEGTPGQCTYLDGIVLSKNDPDFINEWRVENGYEVID